MILDSHQHFWNYEPKKQAWINEDMHAIRKDFLPEMLQKEYTEHGIAGCIAVQADQTEDENNFLIGLAEKNDFIRAIVGWVDFKANDLDEKLYFYGENKIVKGFRHIVQGESDPNFLLRKPFLDGIGRLSKHGFTYDILVFPHQLGAVLEFVRKFPDQKFVLDHIGKPYIKDGFIDGWANQIKALGACENVWCKVSGIITEADYKTWKYKDLEPYLNHILNSFTPARVMFGSDWPVCLVAGSYGKVLEVMQQFVKGLTTDEQDQFWCKNAMEFYNIEHA